MTVFLFGIIYPDHFFFFFVNVKNTNYYSASLFNLLRLSDQSGPTKYLLLISTATLSMQNKRDSEDITSKANPFQWLYLTLKNHVNFFKVDQS